MPVTAQSVAPNRIARSSQPAPSRRQQPRTLPHLGNVAVPVYEQEFWTSKQRQANPLHEVSYRACFKPQLPAYFIERLSDNPETRSTIRSAAAAPPPSKPPCAGATSS